MHYLKRLPNVACRYDFSPLLITVRERHDTWLALALRLIGIVGGIFALGGLVSRLLDAFADWVCCVAWRKRRPMGGLDIDPGPNYEPRSTSANSTLTSAAAAVQSPFTSLASSYHLSSSTLPNAQLTPTASLSLAQPQVNSYNVGLSNSAASASSTVAALSHNNSWQVQSGGFGEMADSSQFGVTGAILISSNSSTANRISRFTGNGNGSSAVSSSSSTSDSNVHDNPLK